MQSHRRSYDSRNYAGVTTLSLSPHKHKHIEGILTVIVGTSHIHIAGKYPPKMRQFYATALHRKCLI